VLPVRTQGFFVIAGEDGFKVPVALGRPLPYVAGRAEQVTIATFSMASSPGVAEDHREAVRDAFYNR